MPNKEYIVAKLEKKDKAWSVVLDKSLKNVLINNPESSKGLLNFYTMVRTAIFNHLDSSLERIITDILKELDQLKAPHTAYKAINNQESALAVANPISVDDEFFANSSISSLPKHITESRNDSLWLEHTGLSNEVIEHLLNSKQSQSLKASLTDCDAARMVAVLVAGALVNAMQANLTPLGIEKYWKLYSNAVVRVIVEKQLGSKGKLTDYNDLIKFLAKTHMNKIKVVPQLVETLIKSAQIGNPYTRAINKRYTLIGKTIAPSKAFTKYGINSTIFKSRVEFLQVANIKEPALLFSGTSCFSLKKAGLLTQYFQLKEPSTFLPTELFFTKAAADYGDAESQFNYGVYLFSIDKTGKGQYLADKYWLLAAQQGVIAAKHNHELFLANTNNSNRDKENILIPNASNVEVEPLRYKAQDNETSTITTLLPQSIAKEPPKLNLNNKTMEALPDLTGKSARLKVASQRTKPAFSSASDNGAYPIGAKIVKRKARSYKGNRDIQILRHITTQLYGFCRTNKVDAIEVQAMYYENSLYIATNIINATRLIADVLKNGQAMKAALTSAYSCGNSSKQKISRRHAHKIRTRIYGDFDLGNERANLIKTLLNSNLLKVKSLDISSLNTNRHIFKHESNNIYVVTNRSQGLVRHAEEDLMDILEAIYKVHGRLSEEPLIYGKRRPCFSCYSRLDSLQDENGPYAKFNQNPGLFFAAAFCSQSPVAATETFLRLSTVSTIYESADDPGYNTLSDSGDDGIFLHNKFY